MSLSLVLAQDLLKARADKAASVRAAEEAKASGYGAGGEGADSLRAAAALNSITAQRIAQVGVFAPMEGQKYLQMKSPWVL